MIVKSHLHVQGVIYNNFEEKRQHTRMPQRQKTAGGKRRSLHQGLILEKNLAIRIDDQGPNSLVTKRKVNVPSRAISLAMGIAFVEPLRYFARVRPSTKHWTSSPEIL
jgi:hypothetical protein